LNVGIHRVAILPFGMVNCHLLIGETGCILVDAGLPGSERKILAALHRHGRVWSDIKLIVVTHAHVDHAGAAANVRALSGAPILAHAGDLEFYEQRKTMTFCDTGWFGRLFLRSGLIKQPYAPFTPDILIGEGEEFELDRFGVPGLAMHTPGHTAGSVSVCLAGGDAVVGDLVASGILLGGLIRTKHAKQPPFEDDPRQVAEQLMRLTRKGGTCFHMGHGGPLHVSEVERHARALVSRALRP